MSESQLGGPDAAENRLGRQVAARLQPPGPAGRDGTGLIGLTAHRLRTFAAGTGRSAAIRRALAVPEPARVQRTAAAAVVPPRWWAPDATPARTAAEAVTRSGLPPRGLPRAVRRVPDESSWTPGGIADSLVPAEIRVRRHSEVSAAGPMGGEGKLNAVAARAALARRAVPAEGHSGGSAGRALPPTVAPPAVAPPAGGGSPPAPAAPPPASPTPTQTPPSPAAPAPAAAEPTTSAPGPTTSGPGPTAAGPSPRTAGNEPAAAAPAGRAEPARGPGGAPAAPNPPPARWRAAPPSARFTAAVGELRRTPDPRPADPPAPATALDLPGRHAPNAPEDIAAGAATGPAATRAQSVALLSRRSLPTAAGTPLRALAADAAGSAVGMAGPRTLRRAVVAPHALRPALNASAIAPRMAAVPTSVEREPHGGPSRPDAPPARAPGAVGAGRAGKQPGERPGQHRAENRAENRAERQAEHRDEHPARQPPARAAAQHHGLAFSTVRRLRGLQLPPAELRPAASARPLTVATPTALGAAAGHQAATSADPPAGSAPAAAAARVTGAAGQAVRAAQQRDVATAGGPSADGGGASSTSERPGPPPALAAADGQPGDAPGVRRAAAPPAAGYPAPVSFADPPGSSALGMTDQLALRRAARHGHGGRALASGLGPAEPIRPATVDGPLGAAAPRSAPEFQTVTGRPSATGHRPAGATPAGARTRPASAPGAAPAPTARRADPARPGQASASPGPAGRYQPAAGTVRRSSLVVAPPPVSVGPRRAGPPVPPVPDVARAGGRPGPGASAATSAPRHRSATSPAAPSAAASGGPRSALYAAAAALFAATGETTGSAAAAYGSPAVGRHATGGAGGAGAGTAGAIGQGPGGAAMSENVPAVRRFRGELNDGGGDAPAATGAGPWSDPSHPIPARQLDEFVDLVVDRIEARVVDELERRGRRTGGF